MFEVQIITVITIVVEIYAFEYTLIYEKWSTAPQRVCRRDEANQRIDPRNDGTTLGSNLKSPASCPVHFEISESLPFQSITLHCKALAVQFIRWS